jgi:hypothetical protein
LANVFFGQFFLKNYRSSPCFGAVFPRKKKCIYFDKKMDWATICINFDNVLGYILGDFFTNSSGHPAKGQPGKQKKNRFLTQECAADVFGNLVSRSARFREVAQLLVQHPFELQGKSERICRIVFFEQHIIGRFYRQTLFSSQTQISFNLVRR